MVWRSASKYQGRDDDIPVRELRDTRLGLRVFPWMPTPMGGPTSSPAASAKRSCIYVWRTDRWPRSRKLPAAVAPWSFLIAPICGDRGDPTRTRTCRRHCRSCWRNPWTTAPPMGRRRSLRLSSGRPARTIGRARCRRCRDQPGELLNFAHAPSLAPSSVAARYADEFTQ